MMHTAGFKTERFVMFTALTACNVEPLSVEEWKNLNGPTLVFSPPFAGPPSQVFHALISDLVSYGCSVVTINHPYEQSYLQLPDGTGTSGLPFDYNASTDEGLKLVSSAAQTRSGLFGRNWSGCTTRKFLWSFILSHSLAENQKKTRSTYCTIQSPSQALNFPLLLLINYFHSSTSPPPAPAHARHPTPSHSSTPSSHHTNSAHSRATHAAASVVVHNVRGSSTACKATASTHRHSGTVNSAAARHS